MRSMHTPGASAASSAKPAWRAHCSIHSGSKKRAPRSASASSLLPASLAMSLMSSVPPGLSTR
ncbi:hypothetical protein D3C85_714620 [compost metagenome]